MQATDLRRDLYRQLARIASDRVPVEISRHGRPLAMLVPSPSSPKGKSKRKPLIDLDAIAVFCKRHGVRGFYLFGSILTDDFDVNSDVDVMLDLQERTPNFHETCAMLDALEAMFGRKVDMLTKQAVASAGMNRHRRSSILASARLIHAAP
jgi:prevent-host-death family protein